jgi:hypothetical protein
VVVPATLVREVIALHHDSISATHPGRKKTSQKKKTPKALVAQDETVDRRLRNAL